MAPVKHSKWMALTWDCTPNHGSVHWTSRTALVSVFSQWSFSGQFLTIFCHLPTKPITPHLLSTNPLGYARLILVRNSKNDLKWPKIKQETNFKLNYIKFNRLRSPILVNKAGLTREKAGYTN